MRASRWAPPPPPLTAVVVPTLVGEELHVSIAAEQTLTVTQARVLARQIIATAEWSAAENTKTVNASRYVRDPMAGATA